MPSNAERLMSALAPVFGSGREVVIDDPTLARMVELLRPLQAPSFSGTMRAQGSFEQTFDDVDGLRRAWADWLGAFASVRLATESIEPVGDNVLMFVRQIGTTRHGVEMIQPSAAVWKFADGLIVRIEFHLDRDDAVASAERPA